MIDSVHFKNYRCFEDFSVNNLSRVNLLVGVNNSGKSSILEGLCFLQSGSWGFLTQVLNRRGWGRQSAQSNQWFQYINLKNSLFNSKALQNGDGFLSIESRNADDFLKMGIKFTTPGLIKGPGSIGLSEITYNPSSPNRYILYNQLGPLGISMIGQIGLEVELSNQNGMDFVTPVIPLFDGADVRVDTFNHLNSFFTDQRVVPKTHFIFPESIDLQAAMQGWSQIAFNNDRVKKIIDVLKLTKADIEGIQLLQTSPIMPMNFYLKLKDINEPYPLGALGDGVRRILYLLLSFPITKGGMVFIDEIETGIHYSLMKNMWEMLLDFSKEYDVQVFASTHSFDCISGLAQVYNEEYSADISIHRIDNKKKKSINYSHEEIIKAVELNEEIRGF